MNLAPKLFRDLVRPCPGCETPYDIRLHAPHVLPCSHTFCLMCLSKHDQRKKRHCLICKAKYSKFAPNLSLMEVLERIDERRMFLEKETRQCDECDNRVMRSMLRQCNTCEKQFVTRTEYKLECIVCLECCVNSHNGHQLNHYSPTSPSSIESSPTVHQRTRQPSTSSTVSVHFRHPSAVTGRLATKGIINTIKSWSFRTSNSELSFLLTPRSKLAFSEEDIVMQCQSPFYNEEEEQKQQQKLQDRCSSSRFLCYDTNNPDNISVDSVFPDSPHSLPNSMAQKSPPYSIRHDSGVAMTPSSSSNTTPSSLSSSHHFSRSSTSLRIPSPSSTTKIPTAQSFFGTTRAPRTGNIRMGVTDIVNTPRRPMPNPRFTSTPNNLNSIRSESLMYPPTPITRRQHNII
uniref:RING-type domain-containing protein n=1 Tax=Caenorhabditis tropicalis TaxID=1561998 RepID=A0A1I7TEP5_9PELO